MSKEIVRIKVEPASLHRKKLLLMLIGFLPFSITAFMLILKGMGERGHFARKLWEYFPYAFILSMLIVAAAITLHFFYRSTLTVTTTFRNELQIRIQEPSGKEIIASGAWSTTAFFRKEYYKLGTYRKYLFLALHSNNKPFCIIRHITAAAESAPAGFTELENPELFMPDAPVFFTAETERIYRVIEETGRNHNQHYPS